MELCFFFLNSLLFQGSTLACHSRRVALPLKSLAPPPLHPWPHPASRTNTRSCEKAGALPLSCHHCCTTLSQPPRRRPTFTTSCAAAAAMTTKVAVTTPTSQRESGLARRSIQRARRHMGAEPATKYITER